MNSKITQIQLVLVRKKIIRGMTKSTNNALFAINIKMKVDVQGQSSFSIFLIESPFKDQS